MARIPTFTDATVSLMRSLPRPQTQQAAPAPNLSGITRAVDQQVDRRITQERALLNQKVALDATQRFAELQAEFKMDPVAFEEAWSAYALGVEEQISAAPREDVIALGGSLKDMGVRGALQLADEKRAREAALTAVEFRNTWDRQAAFFKDRQRADGDDASMHEQRQLLREQARAGFDLGIDTAEEMARKLSVADRDLPTELLFGRVERLRDEGDINGALGVIDSVFKGQYFEDKDYARALAGRLSQLLKEPNDGRDSSFWNKVLEAQEAVAATGGTPNQALVQAASNYFLANGTAGDALVAENRAAGIFALEAFQDVTRQGSAGEVAAFGELVRARGAEFGMSPKAITKIAAAEKSRLEEIAGKVGRNTASLGGQLPPIQNVGAEDWPSVVRQRQMVAARVAEAPPDLVLPYALEDRESYASQYADFLRTKNPSQAMELVSKVLSPAGGNRMEAARLALSMKGQSGAFAVTGLLQTVGAHEAATQAAVMAGIGQRTNQLDLGLVPEKADAFLGERDVADALRGMGMGDATLLPDTNAVIRDLYVGFALEAKSRGVPTSTLFGANIYDVAAERTRAVLAPLFDVQTLENGASIPTAMFTGGPDEVALQVARLDEVMGDRARLGLADEDTRNIQDFYPHPVGGGTFEVIYGPSGTVLPDPEGVGNTPLLISPPTPIEVEQARVDQTLSFDTFGAKMKAAFSPTPLQQGVRKLAGASRSLRGNADAAKRLALAAETTPATDLNARVAGFGRLPVNVAEFVSEHDVKNAYSAHLNTLGAGPGVVPPRAGQLDLLAEDVAPFTLVAYEKALREKFGPSGEAIAAAYFFGPEIAERQRDALGPTWYEHIESTAFAAFLGRYNAAR